MRQGARPRPFPNAATPPPASPPHYIRIAETLRRHIAAGDYQPGDLLPSEAQLMTEFRVSRHTVRAALARLGQDGLITRVKGKGSIVNLVANGTAGSLDAIAGAGQQAIAFCAAEEDPFTTAILWGVEREASRRHISVVFVSSHGEFEQQQRLLGRFAESGLQGAVIMPVDIPPSMMQDAAASLDHWQKSGLHLVCVDRYYPGARIPTVVSDNFGGAYEAVSHLLQIGRRQTVAVSLSNTNTSSVAARLEGYRWAFKDAGLVPNPAWEYTTFLADDNDFLAFLERTRADGLFALNDNIAMRCMQLLRNMGRKIPDDIAVVGFDDVQAASLLDVPLTTVRQDGQRLGEEAARLLLEGPAFEAGGRPRRIKVPVQLVVRASTVGYAAAESQSVDKPAVAIRASSPAGELKSGKA